MAHLEFHETVIAAPKPRNFAARQEYRREIKQVRPAAMSSSSSRREFSRVVGVAAL